MKIGSIYVSNVGLKVVCTKYVDGDITFSGVVVGAVNSSPLGVGHYHDSWVVNMFSVYNKNVLDSVNELPEYTHKQGCIYSNNFAIVLCTKDSSSDTFRGVAIKYHPAYNIPIGTYSKTWESADFKDYVVEVTIQSNTIK